MNNERKWKNTEIQSCNLCGGQVQIHTFVEDDSVFYDGDDCRCTDCHAVGKVYVDGYVVGCELESIEQLDHRERCGG